MNTFRNAKQVITRTLLAAGLAVTTTMTLLPQASQANTTSAAVAAPVGSIGVEQVSFESEGEIMAGNLYLPPNFDPTQKYPAVIVTGSWTTVKEQMAGTYAELLAQQGGYVTLAFDFRGFGESGGAVRNFEDPLLKIQDIRNAATYLESLDFVDTERLAGLGICASAGYMVDAVSQDARFKSLVLVAPWLHNQALVELVYGGVEGVAQRIVDAQAAIEKFNASGEVEYVPAISTVDENAAMFGEWDYYLNPDRGAIPEWGNQFAVMSWLGWLTYDPVQSAPNVTVPTFLVHSESAAIPDGAKQFYDGLTAPKDFLWIEGTQFDFYDQMATIERSVNAAVGHLNETLQFASENSAAPTTTALMNEITLLRDRNAIIDAINAVGLHADLQDWEGVAAQFADSVVLDYGEPATMTPAEIITAWSGLLPGFDYTQHVIANHQVTIRGNNATAQSVVYATHFLENDEGDNYWVYIGNYTHDLTRTEDGWRITKMQARMGNQLGNPDLVTLAGERVQAMNEEAAPAITLEPSDLVNQFVEAVNAGDKEAVAALFSADACIGYSGSCFEADKLASWWDSDIFNVAGKIEDVELTVDGDTVTLTGKFNSTGWSGNANYVFTIADGMITGWDLR